MMESAYRKDFFRLKRLIPLLTMVICWIYLFSNLDAQEIKSTIEPSTGGMIGFKNSVGDSVLLKIPKYAFFEPIEFSISSVPDTMTIPIDSIVLGGINIEPSGMFFAHPIVLTFIPCDNLVHPEKVTIFNPISSSRVIFLDTWSDSIGISARLYSTSPYFGGVVTPQEFEAQISLFPDPSVPTGIRDLVDAILPIEQLMEMVELFGRQDIAREMRLSVLERMRSGYGDILTSPIPSQPCDSYLQGLMVLQQMIVKRLFPMMDALNKVLDDVENAGSGNIEEEQLIAEYNVLIEEAFGSMQMLEDLMNITEKLSERVDKIADICPSLMEWTTDVEGDEKGSIDVWGFVKCNTHSKLTGEIRLRRDLSIRGTLSGEEKVTTVEWGDRYNGCAAGTYTAEKLDHKVKGNVDNETGSMFVLVSREKLLRFKPNCWAAHPLSSPTAIAANTFTKDGWATVLSLGGIRWFSFESVPTNLTSISSNSGNSILKINPK